jgi:hypothetical protein
MIEAKASENVLEYPYQKERLSADIKLTLHKAIIRSIMTYACPAW